MSEPVGSYEEFRDRLHSRGVRDGFILLEERPAVATRIQLARGYLEDYDHFYAELAGEPTLDDLAIPALIREARDHLEAGMLGGNEDLLAIAYALLERAGRRLDEEAEEESGSDPHPSE